ncbi:MAG: TolC family protein [Roseivirga sp.]
MLALVMCMAARSQDLIKNETLNLERAIDIALANNKTLKIEKQFVEEARNDIYKGNAGLLPTVSFQGNVNLDNNQSNIAIRTFTDNPPLVNLDESGVQSTTVSAGLRADYVVIGGFSGRYRYQLLEQGATLAGYRQEAVLNEIVLAVSELFTDIAKLQSREELLEENVAISRKRLGRIENQFKFGQATGTLKLNAQTEINQDLNALDNVRLLKNNLMKELNFLMGVDAASDYRVTIVYDPQLPVDPATLSADIEENNAELKISKAFINTAGTQLKLSESGRYPRLSAYASYGYFRQENDVQQLAELETVGYSVGLRLSYNIFDGHRTKRNTQKARISLARSEDQQSLKKDELVKEAIKENSQLRLLQDQLGREQENLSTFEDNYRRTSERFENGTATSLDLRDAQRALLNARIGINDARLEIVKSSFRLRKLTGQLVSNN